MDMTRAPICTLVLVLVAFLVSACKRTCIPGPG